MRDGQKTDDPSFVTADADMATNVTLAMNLFSSVTYYSTSGFSVSYLHAILFMPSYVDYLKLVSLVNAVGNPVT